MNAIEWEAICDGCARCCLYTLEAKEEGIICYTNVACKHLDSASCTCLIYGMRHSRVPNCKKVTIENIDKLSCLPGTCAYRLLKEGKKLKWWHPLVCGDPWMVHKTGISVQHKVVSEKNLVPEQFVEHVIAFDFASNTPKSALPHLSSLQKPIEGALAAPDFI